MSTTGLSAFDTTVHKTHEWLNDVGLELDGDRHEAYRALRAVLQTLRDWIPLGELADLSAQLPMLLRGILFEGWRPTAARHHVRTLAAFLDQVAERYDGREPRRMTQAVLRVLAHRISAGELADVKHVLPEVLDELWPQVGGAVLLEQVTAIGHEVPLLEGLMTRDVQTAAADAMLMEVLARMERAKVRHLVVVEPRAIEPDGAVPVEAVVGMVTTRDAVRYLRHHPHEATRLDELVVRDVMTPGPLHTARAQADVAQAAALMRRERVSALPVLDASGIVVGMVTADDLLSALELASTA